MIRTLGITGLGLTTLCVLMGCANPLGNYEKTTSRDLWRRLAPERYQQIVELEKEQTNKQQTQQHYREFNQNALYLRREEEEPGVNKAKLAMYISEQIVDWAEENLHEEDPLRRTIYQGERMIQWGETSVESLKEQVKNYLQLKNADIDIRIAASEIGVRISVPLNSDAENNAFKRAKQQYLITMQKNQALSQNTQRNE